MTCIFFILSSIFRYSHCSNIMMKKKFILRPLTKEKKRKKNSKNKNDAFKSGFDLLFVVSRVEISSFSDNESAFVTRINNFLEFMNRNRTKNRFFFRTSTTIDLLTNTCEMRLIAKEKLLKRIYTKRKKLFRKNILIFHSRPRMPLL